MRLYGLAGKFQTATGGAYIIIREEDCESKDRVIDKSNSTEVSIIFLQ